MPLCRVVATCDIYIQLHLCWLIIDHRGQNQIMAKYIYPPNLVFEAVKRYWLALSTRARVEAINPSNKDRNHFNIQILLIGNNNDGLDSD